ncbi:hypothetical protein [Bradyrhizobium genosp. P]|uniref:hypothetical protein n=1 Tax=Bradyrhizobium genosp. P TaxID=83641 RepID=UPI003CEA542C
MSKISWRQVSALALAAFFVVGSLSNIFAPASMLAALATVTLHGEYGHGVAPLVVAALSILVGWIAWRERLSSSD